MTLKLRDYRSSRDVNQGELMVSLKLGHNGNATPRHLSKHFSGILSPTLYATYTKHFNKGRRETRKSCKSELKLEKHVFLVIPSKFYFSVLPKKRLKFDLINLKESAKVKITDSQLFNLGKGKHNEFQRFTVEDKFKLQIASLF